jgi:hypothetical protein
MVRMVRIQKVTGSPSAIQSYLSVASKNPFYHAGNVKYYYFHLANLNQHKKKGCSGEIFKILEIFTKLDPTSEINARILKLILRNSPTASEKSFLKLI